MKDKKYWIKDKYNPFIFDEYKKKQLKLFIKAILLLTKPKNDAKGGVMGVNQTFIWTGNQFEAKEGKEKFVREFIKESFNVKDRDEFIVSYIVTHNQQEKTLKGTLIYDDLTEDFWNEDEKELNIGKFIVDNFDLQKGDTIIRKVEVKR